MWERRPVMRCRGFNSFLHWAVKNRLITPGLEVKKIKAESPRSLGTARL
jgi:hypothetical protein